MSLKEALEDWISAWGRVAKNDLCELNKDDTCYEQGYQMGIGQLLKSLKEIVEKEG